MTSFNRIHYSVDILTWLLWKSELALKILPAHSALTGYIALSYRRGQVFLMSSQGVFP